MLSVKRKHIDSTPHPSASKIAALKTLSIPGIKLSDGYDYDLREYATPETTLEELRKRLASIKTPLSEDIVKDREK